jgi:ankyrin repeat protein
LEEFSDERLWEHLLIGLSSMEKAYCVIDALDEMELLPNDGFLDRLNKLATFRPDAVKLLITSRPKQYLQSSLRDASIVHISLEDDLVGKDINVFLAYRLKNLLPQDDQQDLRDCLVSTISERSRGLFLYARLLLDQIIPSLGSTKVDIEKLVKDLPVGLEEMYNSMLLQQAKSLKIDVQIQVLLLELATHSSRALRLNEVASVLAATFPPSTIPEGPKAIARSACAPLLEILEDETVQVIHHSFTEFLLNNERTIGHLDGLTPQFPVLNPDKVHKKMSIICLDYLRSGSLRLDEANVQQGRDESSALGRSDKKSGRYNYQESKLRHPFLEYAVSNWAFHASKYDFEDDDFFHSVAGFLDHNNDDFRKWLELEWMKNLDSSMFKAPTPLHIAAFAGLTAYAKKLIDEEISVDACDGVDRTPLHWACARGHTSMVSLLLKSGATLDPEDCRGLKPIHEAAKKNHAEIVRMLLEAGVDPLTPKKRENQKTMLRCGQRSTKGETAVEYAYLQGHTDTMMAMVQFLTSEALEEMFCQCCRYGKLEAARAILNTTSVSPNAKSCGATALYLACRVQSVGVVELLLAKGADVHQTSKWRVKKRNACGKSVYEEPLKMAIHGAVKDWKCSNNVACQQVLRLLLNAGADIEAKDAHGNTPLLSLFFERSSPDHAAVKGLLQAGANVLAVDKNGESVVHRCLSNSHHVEILKLLFEYGARIDVLGHKRNSALHVALTNFPANSQETPAVINLLLEKGARCDVENEDGSTAVEDAAHNMHCNLETFTMLLQACSNPDALKRCMWKMGHRKDAVQFIRALQGAGVSLENRDSNGGTVLLKSTQTKELFEAFVECGADLKVVDSNGRGILHHYVSGCQSNLAGPAVQRLVEMINMGLNLLHVSSQFSMVLQNYPLFQC